MFVFNFGGSSLEQSVNLGRLVIFDSLGNSLNTTFSKTTTKKQCFFSVFSLFELFFSFGGERKPT